MHNRYVHSNKSEKRKSSFDNGDQQGIKKSRCDTTKSNSDTNSQTTSGHGEKKVQPLVMHLSCNNVWTVIRLRGGPQGNMLNYYASMRQTFVDQINAFKRTHKNIKFVVQVQLEFDAYDYRCQRLFKQLFNYATREVLVLEHNDEEYIRSEMDKSMFALFETSQSGYVKWLESLQKRI